MNIGTGFLFGYLPNTQSVKNSELSLSQAKKRQKGNEELGHGVEILMKAAG